MGVLLAAMSAVLYGSADFMGGLAARRETPFAVTWSSQFVGLVSVTAVSLVVPAAAVLGRDLVAGAAGGAAGSIGLLLLYRALATGPMAVVAPLTAVCSAVVPVVVGVAGGDRPRLLAVAGLLIAFPAIVLVARGESGDALVAEEVTVHPRVVVESLVAGVMFGLFFVAFARVGDRAGLWPAVAARVASVGLLGIAGLVTRSTVVAGPGARRLVAGAGVLDISANVVYLFASRLGLLSLISVVSAMYPAATVALARVVLAERIGRTQAIGLGLAGLAVALVALGR